MFSSHWKKIKKNRKEKEKNKQITSNKIKSRKFRNPLSMNQPIKYNLRGNILLTIYYLE